MCVVVPQMAEGGKFSDINMERIFRLAVALFSLNNADFLISPLPYYVFYEVLA